MAANQASQGTKSQRVFGQARKPAKMFRAGLYTRVSTNDQQTIPLQIRALREYSVHRGWKIALQVKEVGSGASQRQLREKLLEAARRREIDVVLVWRLDRWGRSVADLLATLQELQHLGVGFVSLTEALDLTTPAGRAMAALLAVFAEFEREILRERVRAGLAHARQNGKRLGRPITAALHTDQVRKLWPLRSLTERTHNTEMDSPRRMCCTLSRKTSAIIDKPLDIVGIKSQRVSSRSHFHGGQIWPPFPGCVLHNP